MTDAPSVSVKAAQRRIIVAELVKLAVPASEYPPTTLVIRPGDVDGLLAGVFTVGESHQKIVRVRRGR